MKSLKTLIIGSSVAVSLLFGTSVFADTQYTVKSGDSLSAISNQFFGSNDYINQIAKDNNIKDVHLIFPGQELTIKTDGVATETPVVQEEAVVVVPENTPVYEENQTESYTGTSSSAKEWIAQRESGGDYNASNGYHVGRYQLDPSYLNGDHSPENQERVADEYVAGRYGSWENAQNFWLANGWY